MASDTLDEELQLGVQAAWLLGIALSSVCITVQLLLLYFIPNIRKTDQKILVHLSTARLANTLVEYLNADVKLTGNKALVKMALTALYMQTDAVLVAWMFVYTKDMYDKTDKVFVSKEWSFLKLSLIIWLGTLPVGILYVLFINLGKASVYQKIYGALKFIVLSVNVWLFCKIFYVLAVKRSSMSETNVRRLIRACVVSFLLVCITSLQVALTDLFSFYTKNTAVAITFCVINSYQVLAITIIFGIVSKNAN